jgi:hypothetical protein
MTMIGDFICPRCNRDVPNADTGRCDLCLRIVCGRCIQSIGADRSDGLKAGTYCRTCLGEDRRTGSVPAPQLKGDKPW